MSLQSVLASKNRWISDARRQLIGFLEYGLKGAKAPDFKPLDSLNSTTLANYPPKPNPSGKVLTSNQDIEYNFLLANLREAEGLTAKLAAECYVQAAMKLIARQAKYEDHPATKNDVFLEAARCIEAWYQKGLQLDEKFYGARHERIREGKMVWSQLAAKLPCLMILQMSVSVLDGLGSVSAF